MYLRPIDLTTALRPSLLQDETLLFVQDAVGLYGGKAKLDGHQNGQAYLTSHRACYVDNEEPRKRAVAVDLKDVDRTEFYGGFIYKSSPKVSLYPKPVGLGGRNNASLSSTTPAPPRPPPPQPSNATWICPICSFSNAVPPTFDASNENTPLNPCQACGIKPAFSVVLKAAIAGMANRQPSQDVRPANDGSAASGSNDLGMLRCPRCTFENHPSLSACEICGASLVKRSANSSGSPGPGSPLPNTSITEETRGLPDGVKFSFRGGGEKVFYERLRAALVQRKWLLKGAPTQAEASAGTSSSEGTRSSTPAPGGNIGIAGLERRGAELRRNNEVVIGNAFEDLAALMASAKEIIALAEQMTTATQSRDADADGPDASALLSQLNLTTTRDMLGAGRSTANNLYLTELCREIAEYLTDDTKGVLKREGGIVSLVDLWAMFNRARGGVELVSPTDFAGAADMFDRLKLPIRLRRFKSGLLVVQERSRTDEKTIAAIQTWLQTLRKEAPALEVSWDWRRFGRGVTPQEAAERFGWSVGVATEELEVAEDHGALCREQSVEGVRFWENWFLAEIPSLEEK